MVNFTGLLRGGTIQNLDKHYRELVCRDELREIDICLFIYLFIYLFIVSSLSLVLGRSSHPDS